MPLIKLLIFCYSGFPAKYPVAIKEAQKIENNCLQFITSRQRGVDINKNEEFD
ncbi:MAG: hypothetical protein ACTS73_02055 [Arsenophonus sp. NEOnobi-MAG3]